MTILSLTPLVARDSSWWVGRASSLYCRAGTLPLWVRRRAIGLALETHANIQSLRRVGLVCPVAPSLSNWVITLALLVVVSPPLALSALRLFLACYAFRLAPYRAIGEGVSLVLGGAAAFVVTATWRLW